LKTNLTLGLIIILLVSTVIYSYSEYGAPSEFGNLTTTTCSVGGDDGILNCTGWGKLGDDLNMTQNDVTDVSSIRSLNSSYLNFEDDGDVVIWI